MEGIRNSGDIYIRAHHKLIINIVKAETQKIKPKQNKRMELATSLGGACD